MHLPNKLFLILGLAVSALSVAAQGTGSLQGRVRDAVTAELLAGANVVIDGLQLGAAADTSGYFIIRNIPRGTYTVRASYLGYITGIQYEVRVESGVASINFDMSEQEVEGQGVEIVASPFAKTSTNLVSVKQIGQEQIRSNPGSNFDISKVVQSLPGVSGSVGFRNDIIVRGGSPNENVFYLDGVETPVINHFATQGAGGGPVGIINSVFVQNINFQSSGFGAQYDNALSSVFDFEMISPNKERFQSEAILSATEAGLTFDTPFNKKKTITGFFSARYSYLQFLFKAIGLPFLPTYIDGLGKVQWEINPRTTLTFIGIGAIDRLTLNRPDNPTLAQQVTLEALPIINQNTATAGLVLKRLTKRGYFTVIASRNFFENVNYRENDTLPNLQNGRVLDYRSLEVENRLRINVVSKLGSFRLGYGGTLVYAEANNRTFNYIRPGDTIRADNGVRIARYGLYADVGRDYLSGRLKTKLGIRTDMNSLTRGGSNPMEALSPRASLSYALTDKINLNASTGVYYKLPPYTVLAFGGQSQLLNQGSRYFQSTHLVFGLDYNPTPSAIVSIEGFLKLYDRYPVSVANGNSLANTGGTFGVFGNEAVQPIGKGRAYGVEIYAQKRLTKRTYGIASYTLYWSEFTNDLVTSGNTGYTRSSWDNRHLASITGGWRFGKKLNWELAGKFRYLGPLPYTPTRTDATALQFYTQRGIGLLDFNRVNAVEAGSFSQVDLRLERRFYFTKWNLTVFIDIQNLFNTFNETAPNFTLARDPNNVAVFSQPLQPVFIRNSQSARLPSIGIRARM